jgi:hypothetical protein
MWRRFAATLSATHASLWTDAICRIAFGGGRSATK